MEKKIFWAVFIVLGLIADFTLPIFWSVIRHHSHRVHELVGRLPQRLV